MALILRRMWLRYVGRQAEQRLLGAVHCRAEGLCLLGQTERDASVAEIACDSEVRRRQDEAVSWSVEGVEQGTHLYRRAVKRWYFEELACGGCVWPLRMIRS